MMSLRESVLAAIATTLTSADVAGGRVYRSRQAAVGTLPAVTIEPATEQVNEIVLGALDHTLTVDVTIFASGDTPDNAADATLDAAISALTTDRTLGLGSAVQVQPGYDVRWDFDDFDLTRVTVNISINMRT
jgi:hypothetical protein